MARKVGVSAVSVYRGMGYPSRGSVLDGVCLVLEDLGFFGNSYRLPVLASSFLRPELRGQLDLPIGVLEDVTGILTEIDRVFSQQGDLVQVVRGMRLGGWG